MKFKPHQIKCLVYHHHVMFITFIQPIIRFAHVVDIHFTVKIQRSILHHLDYFLNLF